MKRLGLGLATVAALAIAGPAMAANIAADNAGNAAYSSGWNTGDNGGSGFGAWTLTGATNAGLFIGDSTTNGSGSSGGINTSGKAFGAFASGSDVANAVRPFTGALSVGQTFSVAMDNGYVDNGGTVGFGLQNSSGENLMEYYFHSGDTAYAVNASNVTNPNPQGFTDGGLNIALTLTSATSFSMTIDNLSNGVGVDNTITGDLLSATNGQGITQVRLFNAFAGTDNPHNAFFNSLAITNPVPEPASLALLAVGGLMLLPRRKRQA